MKLAVPSIEGVIDRRILVNFRIEPDRTQQVLPPRLQPQLVDQHAIGGICLMRLRDIRPRGWPTWVRLGSENAAHRIAVEWTQEGQRRTGVYIPRRDTNSRLNTLIGGRLFPGVHHRADFEHDESPSRVHVAMTSRDGAGSISVDGSGRFIRVPIRVSNSGPSFRPVTRGSSAAMVRGGKGTTSGLSPVPRIVKV